MQLPTSPAKAGLAMRSRHDDGGVYISVEGDHDVLFGYRPADLIGRSAYEFFHPEDLVRIAECHGATLDLDGSPHVVEYRLRHANGHYIDVRTTSRAIDDGAAIECVTERIVRL